MASYEKALLFAFQAHSGQFRKYSRHPYMIHPVRVSEFIQKNFSHREDVEEMRVAAILHDVVEDTWVEKKDVEESFGDKIALFVDELSKDKSLPKKEAAEKYVARLARASTQAKIIKLADIHDNLLDDDFPLYKHKKFPWESLQVLKAMDVDDKVFREKKDFLIKQIGLLSGKP